VQTCQTTAATCIVVSNEVGLGLVPDNPLGRLYRDLLGRANQTLAARAEAVYFMVAGLPVGRQSPGESCMAAVELIHHCAYYKSKEQVGRRAYGKEIPTMLLKVCLDAPLICDL